MGLSFSAQADELTILQDDMTKRVDKVIKALKNNSLSKIEQNMELESAGEGLFDYTLMAKLSIGKREWSKLALAQKKEFVKLFETNMKNSYIEKSHLLSDETVSVKDAVKIKKNRIHLSVTVEGKKDATTLTYKYYLKKGKWLVFDVEIADVSILKTYRAQFAEILRSGSMDTLIQKLKDKQSS
jgi:phospholipid transport system substrate-binding protein